MAQFDLNKYDTVESRLEKFWDAHPEGRILTNIISDPDKLDEVVVRAEIYADREDSRPVSTGIAFEKRGTAFKDGANFTSHVENAETSAIGRAFANWIYKAKKDSPRPSQQEMRKVNDAQEEEQKPEVSPRVAALQKFRARATEIGYPPMTNAEAGAQIVSGLGITGHPTVEQIENATARLTADALLQVPPDEAHSRSAVEAGL